jgi:hypothetical protein
LSKLPWLIVILTILQSIWTYTFSVFRLLLGKSKCPLIHGNHFCVDVRCTLEHAPTVNQYSRYIFTCFASTMWDQGLLFYSLFCNVLSQNWTVLVNVYLSVSYVLLLSCHFSLDWNGVPCKFRHCYWILLFQVWDHE